MKNPPWAEVLQLVPTISLALPFLMEGKVDVAAAPGSFAIGAALGLLVATFISWRGYLQNPIALGSAAWMLLGAIAFYVPLPAVVQRLQATQAFGLFLAALLAGILLQLVSQGGALSCSRDDAAWTRLPNLFFLGVLLLCTVWAWIYRGDIRLGGGLPFIVANVARRALCARATAHGQARA